METNPVSQADFIKVSRLQSIKTKILIFALLATIVPSLTLGWMSYLENSKLLRGRISQELSNATVQASGKLDLWLKERLYDLRVFSSSYIISENVASMPKPSGSNNGGRIALDNVRAYLKSVCDKFGVYQELVLINLNGEAVVTTAEKISDVRLPDQWLEQITHNSLMTANTEFEPQVGKAAIFIAEAIRASNGTVSGVLAAKIRLDSIRSILRQQSVGQIGEIYLMNAKGQLLVSSQRLPEALRLTTHPIQQLAVVPDKASEPADYNGFREKSVVGMAAPITSMGWIMVAEMEKDKAYDEIYRLRRMTVLLVGGLMFCIGIAAYFFGHGLVHPLRRLSHEAGKVAAGDLDVDVPVSGVSEVSYLTQVFNHMVASLRRGREEISEANNALRETNKDLQQLSITDGLTGLYNRMHVMERFNEEIVRSRRYNSGMVILMLDIDNFKRINDTYGHQTGDTVICRVADTLLASVRDCDIVGRYGGEEFLAILPQSDKDQGMKAAERIRQSIGAIKFTGKHKEISVTVSIGVASFPCNGDDAEAVLTKADNALYQAKADGRDQVILTQAPASGGPIPFRTIRRQIAN